MRGAHVKNRKENAKRGNARFILCDYFAVSEVGIALESPGTLLRYTIL